MGLFYFVLRFLLGIVCVCVCFVTCFNVKYLFSHMFSFLFSCIIQTSDIYKMCVYMFVMRRKKWNKVQKIEQNRKKKYMAAMTFCM